jgi:hypothetical protein
VITPIVAGAAALKVFEAIQKAYDIYKKARDFLEGSRGLVADIEAARDVIISEMYKMKRDDLADSFKTLVVTYGEIARNPNHPSTNQRLYTWMDTSLQLFTTLTRMMNETRAGQEGRVLEDAYALAPAFNAIGAMRVSLMNGIPELGFPPLAAESIADMLRELKETNYHLVGAIAGTSADYGAVEPFWGSVFWKSDRFGKDWWVCPTGAYCQLEGQNLPDATVSCTAIDGCSWTCYAGNGGGGDITSDCYQAAANAAKAKFLADPVITVIRFGLARAVQTLENYDIWDDNWGTVTINEA